jgi:phage shock protein E
MSRFARFLTRASKASSRASSSHPAGSQAAPSPSSFQGEPHPDAPVEMEASHFLETRSPGAPVLDVRTPAEFSGGHLQGALNVDVMAPDFPEQVDALGLDAEAPIYLYCRSGNRSGKAARILRERGYHRAFNVGGLDELVGEGALPG